MAKRVRVASEDELADRLPRTLSAGDLNVAVVTWTVQYRITDPYKYMFRGKEAEETFRYMSQAVMREIVGDRTVNEVLTTGREELAISVKVKLQELCEHRAQANEPGKALDRFGGVEHKQHGRDGE